MSEYRDIEKLCEKLDYSFRDPSLIEAALRHSSYVNERRGEDLADNERLEFLGDAVLDLAVSHILMDRYGRAKEGSLSKYRAAVVDEKGLFNVAIDLGLGDYILLGKGEEQTHGREKASILANTMEALLGALYLDAGFARTKEIIDGLFLPLISSIDTNRRSGDFKSLLQEYTQEIDKTRPEYLLMDENGPAHDKTFRVAIRLNGAVISEGDGKSKKEAEQKAAREAYLCLLGERKDL